MFEKYCMVGVTRMDRVSNEFRRRAGRFVGCIREYCDGLDTWVEWMSTV